MGILHVFLYIGAERFVRNVSKLLNVWYPRHGGNFTYRLGSPYYKHFKSIGLGICSAHNSIELAFDDGKEIIAIIHIVNWKDEKRTVSFYRQVG